MATVTVCAETFDRGNRYFRLLPKNAVTLSDGSACVNDTGNKILFRINWR